MATIPVALAGLVVASVSTLILKIRKRLDRKNWLIWSGLPLGCGLLPFVLLAWLIAVPWLYFSFRPAAYDYEEALGVPPETAIRNLNGKTEPGFDSRVIYLAFDRTPAARAEIDRLLVRAERAPNSDMLDADAWQGGVPDWWHAAHGRPDKSGCTDVRHDNFVNVGWWRDIVGADCPSRARIFAFAQRID